MNFNPTEKQVLYILIGMLLVTTVVDMYTAFSSPVFDIAETNPIYVLTQSVVPLLVMTVAVSIWIIVNMNNRISLMKIFLFSMLTFYLSVGHVVGAWSNITATAQYEEDTAKFIEYIEEVTVKQKLTAYVYIVGLAMILPIVISSIAFRVALFFYDKRKSKREKIVDDIAKSAWELYRG